MGVQVTSLLIRLSSDIWEKGETADLRLPIRRYVVEMCATPPCPEGVDLRGRLRIQWLIGIAIVKIRTFAELKELSPQWSPQSIQLDKLSSRLV